MTPGQRVEDVRLVLVVGGDPVARARSVADRVSGMTTPALVLTATPEVLAAGWTDGTQPLVEVRAQSPLDNVAAWRAGAADPEDPVHSALAVGADSPLAVLAGWEYVRRACSSRFWSTVVVDLDGTYAAARRAAVVAELGDFVERNWPENQRFSAMAAGDSAEPRLREAHRISMTVAEVEEMLSGPAEVIVANDDEGERDRIAALVDLARGAVDVDVAGTAGSGFTARFAVPATPDAEVRIRGRRLHTEVEGVPVSVRLPAVLARCRLDSALRDGGDLLVEFSVDPELWPGHLVDEVGSEVGSEQPG